MKEIGNTREGNTIRVYQVLVRVSKLKLIEVIFFFTSNTVTRNTLHSLVAI